MPSRITSCGAFDPCGSAEILAYPNASASGKPNCACAADTKFTKSLCVIQTFSDLLAAS